MKRTLMVAAVAALTACSQNEAAAPEAEATAETAQATPSAAAAQAVMAADGKSPVGTFAITSGDGEKFTEEVKADGTYEQKDASGKVVETGKWVQKASDTYCYTPDKDGAVEECNKEQVDANGVWTSVNPEGKTATVVRVEA